MGLAVYKSSAGSGKTSTLTYEYLRIALRGVNQRDHRHILAITFTNKAAHEMKQRILEALTHFSLHDPEEGRFGYLGKRLMETLAWDRDMLQRQSGTLLRMLLHQYSDLSVSTIDSFMHRVVRTFAYDFSLPYRFDIELDTQELIGKSIDALLSRVGRDADVTHILVGFLTEQLNQGRSVRIERELAQTSQALLQDHHRYALRKNESISLSDFRSMIDMNRSYRSELVEQIQDFAKQGLQACTDRGLTADQFNGKSRGVYGWLLKRTEQTSWQEWKVYAPMKLPPEEWPHPRASEGEKQAVVEVVPALLECMDSIRSANATLALLEVYGRNMYQQAVLSEINRELQAIKDEKQVVHISDLNPILSRITQQETVPFVYERLGEYFRHYFIDEFQDTSHLQWINLLPLLENALAEGYYNLCVGDGKQIIYRWRGSEVEQFMLLPELFNPRDLPAIRTRQTLFQQQTEVVHLNRNFRSKYEVVQANNRLFEALKTSLSPALQRVYEEQMQEADPENTGGYVCFERLPAAPTQEQLPRVKAYLMDTLQHLVEQGYAYKDICILVRKSRDAREAAGWLKESGIAVYSSESLLVHSSDRVRLLYHCWQWLQAPDEVYYQTGFLLYLHRAGVIPELPHEVLAALRERSQSLPEVVDRWGLALDPALLRSLSLVELFETCIRLFGFHASMDAYVMALGNALFGYSTKHGNNLPAFLEWWDTQKESAAIDSPPGPEAVQLLTIHKSKGLEFPVVIMPFGSWDTRSMNNYLWAPIQHKDLDLPAAMVPENKALTDTNLEEPYTRERDLQWLDNVNLYYVAFTRAAERLYVLLPEPSRGGSTTYNQLMQALETFEEFDPESGRLTLGKERTVSQNEESAEPSSPSAYVSTPWYDKLSIAVPSGTSDPPPEAVLGNQVHALLAQIHSVNDLNGIEQTPLLTEFVQDQRQRLLTQVRQVVTAPALKAYFRPEAKAWNELELTNDRGEVMRVDRLVVVNGTYTVLEYKSGAPQNEHHLQLQRYGTWIQRIFQITPALKLIYLDPFEVQDIPMEQNLFST